MLWLWLVSIQCPEVAVNWCDTCKKKKKKKNTAQQPRPYSELANDSRAAGDVIRTDLEEGFVVSVRYMEPVPPVLQHPCNTHTLAFTSRPSEP